MSRPLGCTPPQPVAQTGLWIRERGDGDLEVLYCPPRAKASTDGRHRVLFMSAWIVAWWVACCGFYMLASRTIAQAEESCEQAVSTAPKELCYYPPHGRQGRSLADRRWTRYYYIAGAAPPCVCLRMVQHNNMCWPDCTGALVFHACANLTSAATVDDRDTAVIIKCMLCQCMVHMHVWHA